MSKNIQGFSLIEVLVFVSILSIVFVAAASITTFALRNMKLNEHKILATRANQELLDWLRSEKEGDWTNFYIKAGAAPGSVYCFNESTIVWPATGNCSTYGLNNIFKREATLITLSSNQIQITINVQWQELGIGYSVPVNTIVSLWE